MASWISGIVRTSILVSCIFLFISNSEASVTWKRVIKPTARVHQIESTTQHTPVLSTTRSSAKTPITWKRSTIARRSIDAAESRAHAEELEDLNKASSERDDDLEELNKDSKIKPLAPGSRPGFWFDSTRRKKPASLLRPGTRRNSLFPTRSSATEASTTISVTPTPIIPRTPPDVLNSFPKNVSTRLFGRNRSTKSPITFRRRLKTTTTPNKTTTEKTIVDEDAKNDVIANSQNIEIEEKINSTNSLTNTDEENDDVKLKRPKFNIRRRRPYNGTRLSWTKKRIIRTTTATPQQVTTTSVSATSKENNEKSFRKTTKFPRTRINSRSNSTFAPNAIRSRLKQITTKSSGSSTTDNDSLSKNLPINALGKRNNSNIVNTESFPGYNLEEKNSEKSENSEETYGIRQSSVSNLKSNAQTTIEPFYITKEYGMVATVVPEITKNYGSEESVLTPVLKDEKDVSAQLRKYENISESGNVSTKKEKKRTKIQVTGTPKTSESSEETSNIEKESDSVEDNDVPFEYIDEFISKYTTTDDPVTTRVDEEWTEKKFINRDSTTTTTLRPVTIPVVPTIDPNSNAYVVWSVGHGGSGWSYQKQGGKVQWSAQNSEAEGDNWSVVSEDEEDNRPNYKWTPIRNPADGYKNSIKTTANTKGKATHPLKSKGDIQTNVPVSYIPKLTLKNGTVLNFKKDTESSSYPHQIINNSFTDSRYSSKFIYTKNDTSSVVSQASIKEAQPPDFSSQTLPPFYPTTAEKLNTEVDVGINQHPFASKYPYVAEIRDTFDPLPIKPTNIPITSIHEFQEYITRSVDANQEKELAPPTSFSQEEQFDQILQENPTPYVNAEENPYTNPPNNFNKGTNINQDSTVNAPYSSYRSSIPPELAKAVVKAKKWRVIGNGGNEGWSLLNENGMLEWKIHNVDGHWRVTSAEGLAKTQHQLQSSPQPSDNGRPESEIYDYTDPPLQEPPRVWTLEDDYAKWRAVSVERGIPADKSSEESSTSSEEYDYDNEDFNDNYYPSDDYDSYESGNPDAVSYNANIDNRGKPLWENEKNQIIQPRLPKMPFSEHVEIANTRDDAVAAWKSLIAREGHWEFSGEAGERIDRYPPNNMKHQMQHAPRATKIPDRRISVAAENYESNVKNQHTFSETFRDIYVNENNYQRFKNEYYRDDYTPLQNQYDKNHRISTSTKEHGNPFQIRAYENYNYNAKDQSAEDFSLKPNVNVYRGNYDSLPQSTQQKFLNYENKENLAEHRMHSKEEKLQNQKENKFYDLEVKILGHNNRNEKETPDTINHPEKLNPEKINHNKNYIEQTGNISHYNNHHSHSFVMSNAHMNKRIPEKSTGQILESKINFNNRDHAKLQSLIYKLEAIQRESNGRAVIDLTSLLNQIKARHNVTSISHNKSNSHKHHQQTLTKHHNQENLSNTKGSNASILPKTIKSVNLQETEYLQEESPKQSEKEISNPVQYSSRHDKNESTGKQYSTRSQNHGYRHSGQPNKGRRRKRPSSKLHSLRVKDMLINQTTSFGGLSNSASKESKHANYSISEKTRNIYPTQTHSGKRRIDSSSSEELIVDLRDVDKNKPSVPRRRKRPSRKRSRKPHHQPPIVLKGETELEDEAGSKKSRKIIVIDYAGSQQKRSPVDKKDLELIIRNVKHRRSEIREDNVEN